MATTEHAQRRRHRASGRARGGRPQGGPRRRLDTATVLGLLAGLGLVASAIVLGGSPGAFVDLPALLIVIGGTFAVTATSFSIRDILGLRAVIAKTLMFPAGEPRDAAIHVLGLAQIARTDGVLAIENRSDILERSQFLKRAMGLVTDGSPGDEVERILGAEALARRARHARGAGVLFRAAEVAPAMGLIGTLIGLVQMLGNLDDPSAIGPGMAVALLTTFYGAVLANLVFSPLAAKLERNSESEHLHNRIYTIGAASISRLENPRRLEMLINTVLPPVHRVSTFD